MLARILDISDQKVYLEIDNQLRFRSDYRLASPDSHLNPLDRVSVEFQDGQGFGGTVIIAPIDELTINADH